MLRVDDIPSRAGPLYIRGLNFVIIVAADVQESDGAQLSVGTGRTTQMSYKMSFAIGVTESLFSNEQMMSPITNKIS